MMAQNLMWLEGLTRGRQRAAMAVGVAVTLAVSAAPCSDVHAGLGGFGIRGCRWPEFRCNA